LRNKPILQNAQIPVVKWWGNIYHVPSRYPFQHFNLSTLIIQIGWPSVSIRQKLKFKL
jgi:hypothetical protein